jgi:exopolyphosphatase/guanosine-5'-triphosphate,3'-diphosphate pyrophosphatase
MVASTTALREGILVDLVGRTQSGDIRSRTVSRMVDRFQVDTEHACRVRDTALMLYDQVADEWELQDPELRQLLEWAAELHEIGLFMGYSGHHKHGAYVLAHADLAGFSRQEQRALAALVLGHRGRFSADRLEQLRPRRHVPYRLISLLRVAVRLHRRRSSKTLPLIETTVHGQMLKLRFPEGWLAERPLTATDLELERERCKAVGLELDFQ